MRRIAFPICGKFHNGKSRKLSGRKYTLRNALLSSSSSNVPRRRRRYEIRIRERPLPMTSPARVDSVRGAERDTSRYAHKVVHTTKSHHEWCAVIQMEQTRSPMHRRRLIRHVDAYDPSAPRSYHLCRAPKRNVASATLQIETSKMDTSLYVLWYGVSLEFVLMVIFNVFNFKRDRQILKMRDYR
jgi:hypothetical protein